MNRQVGGLSRGVEIHQRALFRRIADDLRRAIHERQLLPGEILPSENELCQRYNTTRATVRKAITELKGEGLVVSTQGARTTVRELPPIRLQASGANYRDRRSTGLANFNAEMRAQGRRAEQELLAVEPVPCPADVASLLEVEPGSTVLLRRRLFRVDGEPVQFCDGYYKLDLVQGTKIERPVKIKGGVHGVLEDPNGLNMKIARMIEDLHIRMPTPEESKALSVPPGVPVVRCLRTAYDAQGRPIEVLDSLLPSDRYEFQYVIEVPH